MTFVHLAVNSLFPRFEEVNHDVAEELIREMFSPEVPLHAFSKL